MSQWPSTYGWYPVEKWIPSYTPPKWWQTVGSAYSASSPPPGEVVPWRLLPKSEWPYFPIPWEPKVLGAFPGMKLNMREDIGAPVTDPPGPWPSTPKYPPFDVSHVNTPSRQKTGAHQLASVKVHMRQKPLLNITPHPSLWDQGKLEATLREMTRKRPVRLVTESGTITLKSMRSAPWDQHRAEFNKRKAAQELQFK